MRVLFLLGALALLMSGCTRHVKGDNLDLIIKNNPCRVLVKVDGALVLEAEAKKPCKKG